jgi:hypothetical protein
MTIFGILLALLGLGLRYWVNRRAFNRRNAAGVELFNSYEAATGNRLLEGLGRKIGGVLLFVGILLAVFGYLGRH